MRNTGFKTPARIRDYPNVLNLQTQFGAAGDGIIDDLAALQDAIVTATDGDAIFLPTDIWISTTCTINKRITLFSYGKKIRAMPGFTSAIPMLDITSDNCVLDNLTIQGPSSAAGGNQVRGVLVNTIEGFKGYNLKFVDLGWNGLEILSSTNIELSGLFFENCQTYVGTDASLSVGCIRFSGEPGTPTSIVTVSDVIIKDCYGKGFTISASSKITASNILLENLLNANQALGIYGTAASDSLISNVNSSGAAVVKLSANCDNVTIQNVRANVSFGVSYGFHLQGASNCNLYSVDVSQTIDRPLLRVESHPDPNGSSSTNNRFFNCQFRNSTAFANAAGFVGPGTAGAYTNDKTYFYNCVFTGRVGFSAPNSKEVEFYNSQIIAAGGGSGAGAVITGVTTYLFNECYVFGLSQPAIDCTTGTAVALRNSRLLSDAAAGTLIATNSTNLVVEKTIVQSTHASPVSIVLTGATGVTLRKVDAIGAVTNLGSTLVENTRVGDVVDLSGTGSPESVITAGIGSVFRRRDGGASTSVYFKESGTGNTGWIAK